MISPKSCRVPAKFRWARLRLAGVATANLEFCPVTEVFRASLLLLERKRIISEAKPVSEHLANLLNPLLHFGPLPFISNYLQDTPALRYRAESGPSEDGRAVLLAIEPHFRIISGLGLCAHGDPYPMITEEKDFDVFPFFGLREWPSNTNRRVL